MPHGCLPAVEARFVVVSKAALGLNVFVLVVAGAAVVPDLHWFVFGRWLSLIFGMAIHLGTFKSLQTLTNFFKF